MSRTTTTQNWGSNTFCFCAGRVPAFLRALCTPVRLGTRPSACSPCSRFPSLLCLFYFPQTTP
eukprot:3801771-Rhodomonas_salina.1